MENLYAYSESQIACYILVNVSTTSVLLNANCAI